MPVWVTDESGDTLRGATDGHNRTFTTFQPMRMDRVVDVFVNGQRRAQELANGYELLDARTVRLAEAPVPEDTVAVAYCADAVSPAVADGTPRGLVVEPIHPGTITARPLDRPERLRATVDGGAPGPARAELLVPAVPVAAPLDRPQPLRARFSLPPIPEEPGG